VPAGRPRADGKEKAMKLTFVLVVLSIIILAVEPSLTVSLNAAVLDQDQSAKASNPPNLRLWKDDNQIEDLKNILFDFDTHESASEQATLAANAQWLKDHPNLRFKLAGYTDPQGDLVYNLALSQRRAETVKQELIRMGVAEDRISFATGWGELYPNCLEATEECWKQNRRVEFVRVSE
jgi:outer membrane protein OmpA-like peptidoglycan-associated protein